MEPAKTRGIAALTCAIVRKMVHLTLANISVGAKHDRSQYGMITNNLSAVMLRPLLKSEMHPFSPSSDKGKRTEVLTTN
jgi:hypothetical protein